MLTVAEIDNLSAHPCFETQPAKYLSNFDGLGKWMTVVSISMKAKVGLRAGKLIYQN